MSLASNPLSSTKIAPICTHNSAVECSPVQRKARGSNPLGCAKFTEKWSSGLRHRPAKTALFRHHYGTGSAHPRSCHPASQRRPRCLEQRGHGSPLLQYDQRLSHPRRSQNATGLRSVSAMPVRVVYPFRSKYPDRPDGLPRSQATTA